MFREATMALGLFFVTFSAIASAQPAPPTPGEATFTIFLRSNSSGIERSRLERTETGWLIHGNGRITAPIDLETSRFEIEYDSNWEPLRLEVDGSRDGTSFNLNSIFRSSGIVNELQEGTDIFTSNDPIEPTSVVLPNFFFSAYEALAVRLGATAPGSQLSVYVAPHGHITATINTVSTRQLETASGTLHARVYGLTFDDPQQPLRTEVWVDQNQRLMRVSMPTAFIEVAREDIISVSTRLTINPHPGDQDTRIVSSGFSLAATVTTPVDVPAPQNGRWPVILLVPGSDINDRDGTKSGVPIFRQLANTLADRGTMVMRYDKRGVGQSGGRSESASLEDYAEDVRKLVQHLERRPDVDRDRLTVVGYGDGGWVSLIAARRENKIKGVGLIATAGTNGDAFTLEQQETMLDSIGATESERQDKIALQQRIHRAVLGDEDWNGIPNAMRLRADTAWFRSVLSFDPADVIRRIRQPLLIVHGELDQEVPLHHADRIEQLAGERRRNSSTVEIAKLEGLNHALVQTTADDVQNYGMVTNRQVSQSVPETLVEWINNTLLD